jgi:hypothetical protein
VRVVMSCQVGTLFSAQKPRLRFALRCSPESGTPGEPGVLAAEVGEVSYTAFTHTAAPAGDRPRLIARRQAPLERLAAGSRPEAQPLNSHRRHNNTT